MRTLLVHLGHALGASLALVPLAAGAAGDTPFAPGLRWRWPDAAPGAWIPTSVRFAARGEAVWAGGEHGTPRLALVAGGAAAGDPPLLEDLTLADAFGVLAVESAPAGDALFAVAQRPAPDVWHRRTEVSARGPLPTGSIGLRWTHDTGWLVNGPARLAGDAAGTLAVVAVHDPAAARVRVDWLRGTDGALLARRDLPASSLDSLAVSADGSRVALGAGPKLRVFDGRGAELWSATLAAPARGLALSGDGRTLVSGEGSRARLWREVRGRFGVHAEVLGAPLEIAAKVAVAGDGSTWAVAWWDAGTAVDVRLELRDAVSGARLVEYAPTSTGALQNLPVALAVSADGARVALGTWGDGGAGPELVLLDRSTTAPVLVADLPGSVTDLDLDASGTRVAVACKHAHANQVAATGEVRLYDTGERVLRLVGQPRVGGELDVRFSHPDAVGSVVFLLGFRARGPAAIDWAEGALLVDRRARLWTHVRAVDPSGAARLVLPLPAEPALFGLPLAVQALWRRADGSAVLAPDLAEPTIL